MLKFGRSSRLSEIYTTKSKKLARPEPECAFSSEWLGSFLCFIKELLQKASRKHIKQSTHERDALLVFTKRTLTVLNAVTITKSDKK